MKIAIYLLLLIAPLAASSAPYGAVSAEKIAKSHELLQHRPLSALRAKPRWVVTNYNYYCYTINVRLPIYDVTADEESWFELVLTVPESHAAAPVVIDVPTILGTSVLEGKVAGLLCEQGIAAAVTNVIPPAFPTGKNAIRELNGEIRRSVHIVRTVVDFLKSEPRLFLTEQHGAIDSSRIALFGASNGGLIGAMALAVEPRIMAGILVAGGGNLPEMLATSTNDLVTGFREEQMVTLGLRSASELEALLKAGLDFDPLFVNAADVRAKTFQLVVTSDTTVPTSTQEELWNAFGRPKRENLDDVGHTWGIAKKVFFDSDSVIEFIQVTFGMER